MVRIEHITAYVNDLEAVKDFFVKYFGATAGVMYHNQNTGFKSYFLSFGDGCRLEIMTRPEVSSDPFNKYRAGFIHLAFSVGSKENVDALTKRLSTGGYNVMSGPRITGDGYYESCVRGIENLIVEITV